MNKFYYELVVEPNSHYELFLDLIINLVDDAIEEYDNKIIIRSESDLADIKSGIIAFTNKLSKALNIKINCNTILEKKENIDWIKTYQDSIKAIEVGKFYIHPSWEDIKANKINILIDPALTFGSGHHETTSTCLKSISNHVKTNDNILDIGCGSGILAIASAKLGSIVDICDTDLVAVEDSIKNFKANKVVCNSSWEGSCNLAEKTYDVVIANIVADILSFISKDLKKVVKKDGIIILSGIMDKYKDKVLSKFKDCQIVEKLQENEWVTLVVKK